MSRNMDFEAPSVPFTIPDLFHGFAEAKGILRLDERALLLEYQVQDAIFGLIKSRIRELSIACEDIESIRFRKHWWKRTIVVQTRSLRAPASIPGNTQSCLVLRIQRRDRFNVEQTISRLTLKMSEIRLEKLENW
jgi:hypothetical protein